MYPVSSSISQDEDRLGLLAMRFRGAQSDTERRVIAGEYADTVTRLIASQNWTERPPPEDELPDAWMPKEFFRYWS